MNREDLKNNAELTGEFFESVYGDLVKELVFWPCTDISQAERYLENNRARADQNFIENWRKAIKILKEDPERARCIHIGDAFAVIYVPQDFAGEMFEEIFHRMSKIENNYNDEAHVPIPVFLANIWAEKQGFIYEYSLETIAEYSLGVGEYTSNGYKFPVQDVPDKYKGRRTTAKVLEFFIEGNNGEAIDYGRMKQISRNLYNALLKTHDQSDIVMKRALRDLEG